MGYAFIAHEGRRGSPCGFERGVPDPCRSQVRCHTPFDRNDEPEHCVAWPYPQQDTGRAWGYAIQLERTEAASVVDMQNELWAF